MIRPVFKSFIQPSVSMKITITKIMALFLFVAIPALIIARKSVYAASAKTNAPVPISTPVVLNKSLTYSSLMYFNSGLANAGLPFNVFALAMKGFSKLREQEQVGADSILTIIDMSKSSRDKRLYVLDLKTQELVFHSVVSHGRNSGNEYARQFSNRPRSNMSSLGFYVTKGTYRGSNGYSLKLNGTETGFNHLAEPRAIVMHGANYANENVISSKGYLGRSLGCPAVPENLNKKIIDKIKDGNALFIYYPDANYLKRSKVLNG